MKRIIPMVLFFSMFWSCASVDYAEEYGPIVHTFNEAWNTGNFENLASVVDANYTKQGPDGPVVGIEPLKQSIRDHRIAYPDWHCTYVEEVYAKGKAVVRFEVTGTNTGPGEIPATGRTITLEGMAIFYIANGKIVDDRAYDDVIPFYEQLGYTILPPPLPDSDKE